jgi:tetratricopeptide (TPR) repeat protein
VAAGWLMSPGDTFVYSNPYYVEPPSTTVVVEGLNYSDPLPAPTVEQTIIAYPPPPAEDAGTEESPLPTTPPPAPEKEDPDVSKANEHFDAARAAFKKGDYARAQELDEKAIALLPSDATLHEFRALTLFAQKRYKDAAGTLYAVLAAGPGWGWDTMEELYPDSDTYTKQLRALEEHVRGKPDDGAAHFLLAYHYLVMGSKDAAVWQLKETVRVQPEDKLAAALLKALTQEDKADKPAAPPGGTK